MDFFQAVAIQSLFIRTWRHITGLTLYSFVGHNVECRVVQKAI